MSAPMRFLLVAIAGWVVLRGVTAGMLPDLSTFAVAKAETPPEPSSAILDFAPISQPVAPATAGTDYSYASYYPSSAPPQAYVPYPQPIPRYVPIPIYYPAYAPAQTVTVPLPPAQSWPVETVQPETYSDLPPVEQMEFAQVDPQIIPGWAGKPQSPSRGLLGRILPEKHLNRLQFNAWALLRGTPGTGSLASGGTLGGSQAGARLTYALDPRLAVSLRSSSPVGGSRGGEVAAGIRLTPIPSIPLSITAERRQAIGRFGTGRSDFALFAEGGAYQRPIGWNLMLDGYAQAGVVGLRERDFFADRGFTLSRPVLGRFSLGLGAWGGYQPGLYRVDAGPRLSYRLRPNVSLHLDWRQRLAGAAQPSSGPALTLGANF